jgi:drug/metabolite transporter (DMT)-like permease
MGALVGSVVAAGGIVVSDAVRGNLRQRWEDNLRDVPLPFVIAGVLAGVGQLTQFASLQFTTVARSTVIASAEPMITALLSVLFFRQLDTVTPRSGIAVAIIVVGIGIVAFKP